MANVLDMIVSGRFHDDPGGVCRWAQSILKKPAANHSPENPSAFAALCDRFILDKDGLASVQEVKQDILARFDGITSLSFRVPLSQFFLGTPVSGFLLLAETGDVMQFRTDGNIVFYVGVGNLAYSGEGARRFNLRVHVAAPFCDDQYWSEQIVGHFGVFIASCVAISQPNVANVRRVVPGAASRAERRAVQRAMQRGRPMFSYNVVTMKCGRTSRHGGEVCGDNPRAGVRAHWRTGHWRLIVPVGRPAYFTWVDATECGDPERGRVVKERHVEFAAPTDVRRGFLVPDFEGRAGVRVPAKEVA